MCEVCYNSSLDEHSDCPCRNCERHAGSCIGCVADDVTTQVTGTMQSSHSEQKHHRSIENRFSTGQMVENLEMVLPSWDAEMYGGRRTVNKAFFGTHGVYLCSKIEGVFEWLAK